MPSEPRPSGAAPRPSGGFARDLLTPRYVMLLSGVALLVLVGGALLRPPSRQPASSPPSPASELVPLQERSMRGTLQRQAEYMASQAAALAPMVAYVPRYGSSAMVLAPDSLLIARRDAGDDEGLPVRALRSRVDSVRPVRLPPADEAPPLWSVAVARRPDGQLISVSGLYSGRVPTRCGGVAVSELIFDAPLHGAFVGGGLFDLDGNVLGAVLDCGGRPTVIDWSDVSRALARQNWPDFHLYERYGLRVAPLDSLAREVLAVDSGLVVTDVWNDSRSAAAGLRPGDVIVTLDSLPVLDFQSLQPLLMSSRPVALEVVRRPRSRAVALRTAPDTAPARPRLRPRTGGFTVDAVPEGSAAAAAGIQPGDVVETIDGRPATALGYARVLDLKRPVFVVFEHDGRRRGAILRP